MACDFFDFECRAGELAQSAIGDAIENMANAVMEAFGQAIGSLGIVWVHIGTPNLTGTGHEDARLIIDLSRWAQEWGFHDANRWVRSHVDELAEYDTFIVEHPPGSNEYKHPFTVLGYFENVGLFHKHNVLDESLLFDWLDFEGPWKLLGDFALAHRTDAGEPTLWCNFEALAHHQQQRRATDG